MVILPNFFCQKSKASVKSETILFLSFENIPPFSHKWLSLSMIDARIAYGASVVILVVNVCFCVSTISAYLVDMEKVFGFLGRNA